MTDNKPYPDLPPPDFGRARRLGAAYFGDAFTADQMRAYVDADRAMRAAEPAVAQAAPSTLIEEAKALFDAMPIAGKDDDVYRWSLDAAAILGRFCGLDVQAAPVAVAPDSNHDALRCAVGNCTFNGEVTQHAATCPKKPAAVAGPSEVELRALYTECRKDPRCERQFWFVLFAHEVLRRWGAAPQQESVLWDERAAVELFDQARAGSNKPAGTLRGIRAVIASWEARPEPHRWLVSAPVIQAAPQPVAPQGYQGTIIGPLGRRTVLDAIRSAYDLGYSDARNARTYPGDSAPGYKGRDVEKDHGGALVARLNVLATQPQEAAPSQDAEEAVKQCLEAGETFRALRRIVNLLLEARGTLGPEDHELRERIDALLKADAARAQQEGK